MVIISSDNSILVTKSECDFDIRVNPDLLDFSLYTQNSTTTTLSGNGLFNSKLKADVKLSTNPDNALEIDGTGLLVLLDSSTFTDEFVKVTSSDTTAGHLNSKLSAGSGITFTTLNPGGNEQIQVSFSGALSLFTNDSSSVDFSGAGTSGSPLTAVSKISSTGGNLLSINSDGLYGAVSTNDSSSIDFSGAGTSGSPITAVSKISANAGNGLSIQSDGLYSAAVAALTGDVTTSGSVATVVGIKGVLLPSLSTGFLRYNGSAWIFDSSTYLTASGAVTSITGTANQVLANGSTSAQVGSVTLTLPQNIHTAANPTFNNLTLTGSAGVTGNVTAAAFFESSDKRLKTLLEDNPIIDTSSVTPKRYLKEGKEELGYFAQDVQEVLPYAVKQNENSFLSVSYKDVFVAKIYALEQEVKELKSLVQNLLNPF